MNKIRNTRKINANLYFKHLKKINKIKLFKISKNSTNFYHQFVIKIDDRDKLQKYLKQNQVDTMIHYPYMLNELKIFKKYIKKNQKFLNSKNLGQKILSLPISEDHKKKDILRVIKLITKYYKIK